MPELAGRVGDGFAARIRELEEHALSPLAVRSYESRGRERDEEECSVRTPFQRDRDRILHSKPFRRLKGKTQVFIDPAGDHYRTRMTHTLETTGIARVVARALRLNEDLTEAIGLGHDLGHPPFGHAGEAVLDELLRESGGDGFRHNEQSAKIARRLNLSYEVVDGIHTHTGDREPLGPTGAKRIDTLVHDLVESSSRAGDIVQSDEIGAAMLSLRSFMFERVYLGESASLEHERAHAAIRAIYAQLDGRGDSQEEIVEFIAGMTDRFALSYAERL
jgi:dGTPase